MTGIQMWLPYNEGEHAPTRHLMPPNKISSAKNLLELVAKVVPWNLPSTSQAIAKVIIVCFLQSHDKSTITSVIE